MKDDKNIKTEKDDSLDERIRNTANLLARFAKENLDKASADEVMSGLSGIVDIDD